MSLSPYGLLELPLWGYALVTLLTIQTMFLGVTLYLHRDQSHGGLILHRALRHVFRFWLWFSSGAVTRQWVAVHRPGAEPQPETERSEEHTSELQSHSDLVCRLLLEKKKQH